jgi:hypothetical protein
LAAAHVVKDATSVRARFDADRPGEWSTEAITCWVDPRSDLAVLSIAPREGEPMLAVAGFGRISDRMAVLAVQAVGFPQFKLKNDDGTVILDDDRPRYRDSHQADGSVAVLSNRREGTLEVTVPPPEWDPDSTVSPWEGMSGAAVWVGERIVGVIIKHHHSDGPGRLAAARLDLALESVDSGRRADLRTLLGLPDVLPDVVPPSTSELVTAAYQAQVRDIVPDRLLDRDAELDELVRFCAREQPYLWWQADPWAGKSALMAWFVLHPPAGVDVVSFFVTARLAGQSDSDACTDALIEQLGALVGESPAELLTARTRRRGTMLRLLDDAARRAQEAGRRLLLVIDGLDEDSGAATGFGRSSIAALLPRWPPPKVRVVVASRPHPLIPDDVIEDHPLRTVDPRTLAVSKHARGVERRATLELTQLLLSGPELQRDVLGFITAGGGGFTLRELAELTEHAPFEVKHLLDGIFGRSVGSRIGTPLAGYPDERVYLLAHEKLGLVAEQLYGTSLVSYRDRLHAWADTYRQRVWPADTPLYLLRSYPHMLANIGDLTRLVTCATDVTRHNRMRSLAGGDALADTEISVTQELILAQPNPDLASLALLAIQREYLADPNNVPTDLPAVCAGFGQLARAEALAKGIPDLSLRVEAFVHLIEVVAAGGHPDQAIRLATEAEVLTAQIANPKLRVEALIRLAAVAATVGDHDCAIRLIIEAVALTTQITDLHSQIRALIQVAEMVAQVAEVAAAAGDHDRAKAYTAQITEPDLRAEALGRVAAVVATGGDHDRVARLVTQAEALIAQTHPDLRARPLARIATVAAATGNYDWAATLAAEITEPGLRAEALAGLAEVAATCGDYDWAATLTAQITDPGFEAEALARVAAVMVSSGDHDRAARLATDAEALTPQIIDPDQLIVISHR